MHLTIQAPPLAYVFEIEERTITLSMCFTLIQVSFSWLSLVVIMLTKHIDDFSITSIYMPPSSDGTVVSLPTRGELTIGYGDGGAAPLQFAIDDHLEKDLGFFKVYFSLSPSEMSTIQQNGIDPNQRGDSRPGGSHYNHSSPPYGSIQYPLAVLNPHRSRH
jgi:hypothetical protein